MNVEVLCKSDVVNIVHEVVADAVDRELCEYVDKFKRMIEEVGLDMSEPAFLTSRAQAVLSELGVTTAQELNAVLQKEPRMLLGTKGCGKWTANLLKRWMRQQLNQSSKPSEDGK